MFPGSGFVPKRQSGINLTSYWQEGEYNYSQQYWSIPLSWPRSEQTSACHLSILATINFNFNVMCNAAHRLKQYYSDSPSRYCYLIVTKWCTENNSNTRFQCVSQKYCQYLLTADDEAKHVTTGQYRAHLGRLVSFLLLGSLQLHDIYVLWGTGSCVCVCLCLWDK